MNLLRLLFDNLGLKLVALLLALLVYLNVYTERPATMVVSFPIQLTDLSDSLAISGPAPAAVQAELRGTGKQLIRLWLTEPRFKISLAGIGPGRFERHVSIDDLPLMPADKLKVERLVNPERIDLRIEHKLERRVPVAARVTGVPRSGSTWAGDVVVDPAWVVVRGPHHAVAALDSVRLATVRIAGSRDSVHTRVGPIGMPDWTTIDPPEVLVTVPIVRGP